jgi:molybdate transport system substrate-binding protein
MVLSCAGTTSSSIIVAAASNTRYIMEEFVQLFCSTRPCRIKLVFGSSGSLAARIVNMAPYDLFLSADEDYPRRLYSRNIGMTEPAIYAGGKLVLVNSVSFTEPDISNVLNITHTLALANPKQAPYGKAAIECLEYYHKNTGDYTIVYGSNVTETAHFLLNGIEAAFLPLSFLHNPDFASSLDPVTHHSIDVPDAAYQSINQAMLLLTEKGREFYSFLLSTEAGSTWKEYGYVVREKE